MLASPLAWWNAEPHFGTVNLPYSKNKSFALSFHRLRRLIASLCWCGQNMVRLFSSLLGISCLFRASIAQSSSADNTDPTSSICTPTTGLYAIYTSNSAFRDWMATRRRSEKYDGGWGILAEAQTNVCGEFRGWLWEEMGGWIWSTRQLVLVDVVFLLFYVSVSRIYIRSCDLLVDTPSNPRVSFFFHLPFCVALSMFTGISSVLCKNHQARDMYQCTTKCATAPSLDRTNKRDTFWHFCSMHSLLLSTPNPK